MDIQLLRRFGTFLKAESMLLLRGEETPAISEKVALGWTYRLRRLAMMRLDAELLKEFKPQVLRTAGAGLRP